MPLGLSVADMAAHEITERGKDVDYRVALGVSTATPSPRAWPWASTCSPVTATGG